METEQNLLGVGFVVCMHVCIRPRQDILPYWTKKRQKVWNEVCAKKDQRKRFQYHTKIRKSQTITFAATKKSVILKLQHNLQTNDLCNCVNYWSFAFLIACAFVYSSLFFFLTHQTFALAHSSAVKLSAIPFMLLGFLFAVLAQMSLLGRVFEWQLSEQMLVQQIHSSGIQSPLRNIIGS